jgi:ATP-binding protein involved in chromosome partitioning
VDQTTVLEALRTVQDPELQRSIVDLGMVRDVTVDDARVAVRIVLTTAACPLRNRIQAETEEALAAVAEGRAIDVTMDAMTSAERDAMATSLRSGGGVSETPFGPGSRTRVIAVASGKGGVGKSTVTANLAVALAQQGHAVGLIDADVYGPTIPLMFGLPASAPPTHKGKLVPPTQYGVKVVSMGFFLPENEPVIWRGPMLGRAIEQFLGDVLWGSPDFLLIDLPPGTGDVALTIAQMLPAAEMIIVTTPQEAASKVAIKAAKMARATRHHIAGVIENMTSFTCPGCGETHHIFGRGGAFEIAQAMQTTLLGRIPLDEAARQSGDAGRPPALDPADPVGAVFHEIARTLATQPAPKPTG